MLCVRPHLVWSSLEDAGALVDGLGPQTDVFVLQLLGCAVHGLGNQATFRYLTLQVQTCMCQHAPKTGLKNCVCVTRFFFNFLTHHAVSPQEIRNDLLVYVVHQPSRTLVVVACIDEELLAGVFINEWTHLGAEADVDMACS